MSLVKIQGNTLGTGTLLIAAPNTNSDITLNLPTTMGANNSSSVVTTDAAGNLGLGVTPSAWESAYKVVQIGAGGSVAFGSSNAGAGYIGANVYADSAGIERYIASSRLAAKIGINTGAFQWFTAPSGTAGAAISFVQAMTLDASGLLALGTTSPASATRLTLDYPGFVQMVMRSSGTDRISLYGDAAVSAVDAKANPLAFYAGSAERARIDSSGNLLVGKSATSSNSKFEVVSSLEVASFQNTGGTGNFRFLNSAASTIGYITWSGSTTTYVTSSDYRLKENIAPMTGALATVAALKPVTYKWKVDGANGQGFIAHELAEVVSECVVGEKDAVDAEGKPEYQGIDTSFLVATLTAAIQELKAIVDGQAILISAQGAEIATLKGTA